MLLEFLGTFQNILNHFEYLQNLLKTVNVAVTAKMQLQQRLAPLFEEIWQKCNEREL